MITKFFLGALFTLAVLGQAMGETRDSGKGIGQGGGGLQLGGQFYTFAELGIRPVDQQITPYDNQIMVLIDSMLRPLGDDVRERIVKHIFDMNVPYVETEIVDQDLFDKILQDYKEALGPKFRDQEFKLYAMTDTQKTLVFPDYFKLSPRQKASIMVHESFFRGEVDTDLATLLKFDFELKNYHEQIARGNRGARLSKVWHLLTQLKYRNRDKNGEYTKGIAQQAYMEVMTVAHMLLETYGTRNWLAKGPIFSYDPRTQTISFDFMAFNLRTQTFDAMESRYLYPVTQFGIYNCSGRWHNERIFVSLKDMKADIYDEQNRRVGGCGLHIRSYDR